MHLLNVVATPLRGVRIVLPVTVDAHSAVAASSVASRRSQTAATVPQDRSYGIHYCRSQRQRLQRVGQACFDVIDQLRNVDRLGERSMPLDAETCLCFRHCD